jgi:radical SAM protein with 4Fe4S-binding SPASM domain
MEFPYADWAECMLDLTRTKLAGELPNLALSVPAPWDFYLPLVEAGQDVEQAERVWRYRAPLRESTYRASGAVGDPSGIADLNVVANGDVFPITLMSGSRGSRCGNVRTDRLSVIWRESAVLWRLRDMRRTDLPAICRACDIVDLCGGGNPSARRRASSSNVPSR